MLPHVIRAVIFDLDGTLVHSLPGLTASLNRVLENAGLPTHLETSVRNFIGNGIHKLIKRATPENHPIKDLVLQMSNDYAATWQQGTSPYPGIAETLNNLGKQGIAIAVFSNKPHAFCREMTNLLFPGIPFSAVIGQREGVPIKPDPTGALEITEILGIDPQEILFVGDSTIDITTARNASMIPVAVTWGYHDRLALEMENPPYLIHQIEQLQPITRTHPTL